MDVGEGTGPGEAGAGRHSKQGQSEQTSRRSGERKGREGREKPSGSHRDSKRGRAHQGEGKRQETVDSYLKSSRMKKRFKTTN